MLNAAEKKSLWRLEDYAYHGLWDKSFTCPISDFWTAASGKNDQVSLWCKNDVDNSDYCWDWVWKRMNQRCKNFLLSRLEVLWVQFRNLSVMEEI